MSNPVEAFRFRTKLRLVVDLQTCAKAQASRAYARKVKLSNLQQMAQTICYVQEHGYDTLVEIEHDRQMNITALGRLTDTLRNTDNQISRIESSLESSEQKEQVDILRKIQAQLLTNQNTLKQNIRNLQIVATNVHAILHHEPELARAKEIA